MLKNLLAVLTILLVFATTTSAQNKYFLTYYNKAQKLYDAEDYINAKLYYDSAIKKNPSHAKAYYKRGLCIYAEENLQGALKDFNKSIVDCSMQKSPAPRRSPPGPSAST